MRHENPLGYLIALEGFALMRAFLGEHDRDFVERRIAEVRRLLERLGHTPGVDVASVDSELGYRAWARTYDAEANPAFADREIIERLVDDLEQADVLDAACGTGRHSRWLSARGHRVTGVDTSIEMLDHAGREVPGARFLQGSLTCLPFPDGAFDLALCTLALTHVRDLAAATRELARVVRPHGRIVIVDVHPESVALGSVPAVRTPAGAPGRIETYRHPLGDYIRAALASELVIDQLLEPHPPAPPAPSPASDDLGPWDAWPWSLRAVVPEAAAAASSGVPSLLVLSLTRG